MNRAERRRQQKKEVKQTKTYCLTQEQLDIMVREKVNNMIYQAKQEATDDAINTAMTLLLVLPMEVLMDHYWQKDYQKKIPKFAERILEYYSKWQDGELNMDKMKQDLWDYAGIRLEEAE